MSIREIREKLLRAVVDLQDDNATIQLVVLQEAIQELEICVRDIEIPEETRSQKLEIVEWKEETREAGDDYIQRGILERRLRGGLIRLEGGPLPHARVSETYIREHQMEDGDQIEVRYSDLETGPYRREHYAVITKANRTVAAERRIEMRFAIVRIENQHVMAVDSGFGGDAPVDQLTLLPKDVERFSLEEGDVVDVAYWQEDAAHPQVVWKYVQQELSIPSRKTHIRTAKKINRPTSVSVSDSWKGITVGIIGMEPRHPVYLTAIQKRGGAMIGLRGKDSERKIQTGVKKTDVVILMAGYVSHAAHYAAKSICKQRGIPFLECHSFGTESVLTRIQEGLALREVWSDSMEQ